jgi:MurNAc alpha-1-phosphate uridylyltransferase
LTGVGAVGRAGPATVAVNASYLAGQVVTHVGARAHMSVEPDHPLGTAGALGKLRDWIAGRGVLVGNADAYLAPSARPASPSADIAALLDSWDGKTVRLLGVPAGPDRTGEFGDFRFAGFSLLPWDCVRTLGAEPSELVRTVWRPAEAAGALEVVAYRGAYLDTGTPGDYLAANLHAAGGGSLIAPDATVTGRYERTVVGTGAVVHGDLTRAVVWAGGHVAAGEHLVDAIRVGSDLTVPAGGR